MLRNEITCIIIMMAERKKNLQAYCAAVPFSALPQLKEFLEPFLGTGQGRANVVMMRLADESLQKIDQLVDGGLFGSRSEAAAFLVGAGIHGQRDLFEKIERHSKEIKRVRQELRGAALEVLKSLSDNAKPRKRNGPPKSSSKNR